VGVVEESGGGWLGRRVLGKRVAVLNGITGNWAEHAVIPAHQAIPVPADLPDEQVASFFVNPATAWAMVKEVLRIPRGDWLLQTAAGSALGRMVIRLARQEGIRTINVVRRPEQASELKSEGADEVVCNKTESLPERVQQIAGDGGVHYALDAVAGTTGAEALASLGRGGRMLVYGALSGESTPIDPRVLIVGQKRVEGFWLKEWMDEQSLLRKFFLMKRVARLIRSGTLATPIGEQFPLDRVQDAVRAAEAVGHGGKVLLRIGQR
jgi:NADPH:quinone reductase-like Zn-dependent oxidoreductase